MITFCQRGYDIMSLRIKKHDIILQMCVCVLKEKRAISFIIIYIYTYLPLSLLRENLLFLHGRHSYLLDRGLVQGAAVLWVFLANRIERGLG